MYLRVGLSRTHNGSRFPILAFMTMVTTNQKMYPTRMYLSTRKVVPRRHPALATYCVLCSFGFVSRKRARSESSRHFLLIIPEVCSVVLAMPLLSFALCNLVNLPALSFERIDRDMRYLGQGRFSYENTGGCTCCPGRVRQMMSAREGRSVGRNYLF
jgi:hypothetical protein